MTAFCSVRAELRNTDPAMWLLPDGSRAADLDEAFAGLEYAPVMAPLFRPRPEYVPATSNPENIILTFIREGWDAGDSFGSAMNALFPVLRLWELWQDARIGTVPAEYGWRDAGEADVLFDELDQIVDTYVATHSEYDLAAILTVQDMIVHAARVLNRIIEQARLAGTDY